MQQAHLIQAIIVSIAASAMGHTAEILDILIRKILPKNLRNESHKARHLPPPPQFRRQSIRASTEDFDEKYFQKMVDTRGDLGYNISVVGDTGK